MPNGLLYTRQEQLQLITPNCVTVVGCGGIGSWVAIYLAMSGVPKIFLFDPDLLEEHNRNRLPFCQSSIGRAKVDVLTDYIYGIRPECTVVGVQEKLEDLFLNIQISISDYIIECTDSPKSQLTVFQACKNAGRSFIRAGYDGTHITVTNIVSGWIPNTEQENYTVAPSWVVPASVVAALAVGRIMKYPDQEVNLDLNEIGVPVLQRQKRKTSRCRS